ncbi:MAG: hypothetical protein D8M57_13710 [Candidatus Scalindua sp. AMX11]|nr:MAG: hypothetical protein DWQ00_06220 [Candidatus Scalindua sp.]NOG83418.1 hypothetical protein [Planctomycetota bacterium]RZV75069.1 MAG: hypothetical protein EX341_12745 [Candidatus Scalindua sp. SCAELEC01]TDE64330.1 MAG: hypothetical protein D8M57_13710 [Candidatus Scalindua sp. AMX11]GJQ60610.1 MAG: hypothetical protein SCALA701_34110 [Candidatus Scalindua sp.]
MKIDNTSKNFAFHTNVRNGIANNSYTTFTYYLTLVVVLLILGVHGQSVQANPSDNLKGAELKTVKESIRPESQDILDGAQWKLFKGDKNPRSKWNHIGFDDKKWLRGKSGFGYGNSKSKFKLNDMKNRYDNVYVRREFTVEDLDNIEKIILRIDSDGAFIAYLNGIEIIRNKVRMNEDLDISGFTHELLPGTNVLSIRGFNDKIDSRDFTFIPQLKFIKKIKNGEK